MKTNLLSKSDNDELSDRGRDELFASNAYRYAATCFLKQNLLGFVAFCRKESDTELTHRTKLELFANDMGAELEMYSIPPVEFKDETPMGIMKFLFKMENDLLKAYEKAWEEADRIATKNLFQEMVEIQVEGVGEIGDLIAEIESVGIGFVNQRLLNAA